MSDSLDRLQELEAGFKKAQEELVKAREELETQRWGLEKTNESIKILYKELEKKNKELQKLDELKSNFVYTVSHELRTPLTTIRESVSQVLDGVLGETTPQQKEYLGICLEDVDRLRKIIDNLLDISKIEAGKVKLERELFDIVDLAKKTAAHFVTPAKKKGLEIKEALPKREIGVFADHDRIIQVFTNLIGNAMKFTKQGYIELSVVDKGEYVECSVRDTGQGISEDDLPKVFSKFQQFHRKDGPGEKGTGLGLSISKGIIELHNCEMWLESKVGEGTKFIFTLPKYTPDKLLKEFVERAMKDATKEKQYLSILALDITQSDGQEEQDFNALIFNLEKFIRSSLGHSAEVVLRKGRTIIGFLPEIEKQDAIKLNDTLQHRISLYLKRDPLAAGLEISSRIISFPDDVDSAEKIFEKLKR